MPVELDVENSSGRLAPGMFSEVIWPTRRPRPSLFVPPAAIAVTTERTFVVRIRDGAVEWVDVKRGASMNHQGLTWWKYSAILSLEIRSPFVELMSCERAQR
jgi:hypothetical protein